MLKNFRLVPRENLTGLGQSNPVIYALCFDVDGLLIRVGWTQYPGSHLVAVVRGQAALPQEVWVADYRPEYTWEFASTDPLRDFAGRLYRVLGASRIRKEFFRIPMKAVDDAFSEVIAKKVSRLAEAA